MLFLVPVLGGVGLGAGGLGTGGLGGSGLFVIIHL